MLVLIILIKFVLKVIQEIYECLEKTSFNNHNIYSFFKFCCLPTSVSAQEATPTSTPTTPTVQVNCTSEVITAIVTWDEDGQGSSGYVVDVNDFLNTAIKGTHNLAFVVEDLKKKAGVN